MSYRRLFTPEEWEVLQYVVANHPRTARDIAAHFAATHGWVRTTVLSILNRLCKKGYLVRSKTDGVYMYAPEAPGSEALLRMVRDFVRKALGGVVSPFVTFLTEEATLSAEELAQLKQVVQDLETREGDDQDAS